MKLKELIAEGQKMADAAGSADLKSKYDIWCSRVRTFLKEEGWAEREQAEIKVKMHYTENEFSEKETTKSLGKAISATIAALEEQGYWRESEITENTALMLAGKILNNFYMHYRAMYKEPMHKGGTLTQEALRKIQIGNAYDLQRMLYSLLLPVFPTIRQEVVNDNGYSGMRADLYLDEYDLIIETKCTRKSMNEKKLIEELGADGFHYKASAIFFLVYDKNHIIKNPEAFKSAFARRQNADGKTVKMFIIQPMEL